jgi:hypothetical protein
MTIICTTPAMGGTLAQADYEDDISFVREVVMDHNGVDWVCPLIYPKMAWRAINEIAVPIA